MKSSRVAFLELCRKTRRTARKLRFHLFFKSKPDDGEYCASKRIHLFRQPPADRKARPYLAIMRCGATHRLVDDGGARQFDLALNFFAPPTGRLLEDCEYAYSGGVNKYKGARQFIDDAMLDRYRGFIFLDDDLEITYSELSRFLDYCWAHRFRLAQPSLSSNSYYSHPHLLNAAPFGWRQVHMIEVMCPYFPSDTLRIALDSFDLSYSTWGLDELWPVLLDLEPVVVDEFTIWHTRAVQSAEGTFYKYLKGIGVSPHEELWKLKKLSQQQARSMVKARARRSGRLLNQHST